MITENNTMNKTTNRINNNNKYNNNIIIISDTHPGVSISPEDGERIVTAYTANIAPQLTAAVAAMIEEHIARGLTVDDVLDAINRTGFAPRPSPAYLRAVLRNYNQKPLPQKVQSPQWWQKNPALDYAQRDYSGQTFEDDSFMDDARAYLAEKEVNKDIGDQ
jgi:hypothetical protein